MLLLQWRLRTTGQRAAAREGAGAGVDEGVDAAGESGDGRIDGALRWPGRLTPHLSRRLRAVRLPRVVASN